MKNMTQRPLGVPNLEAMAAKKSVGKSSTGRPPRELDANGQPIRKPRAKRAPKPIEEVSVYFRVRSLAERRAQEAPDAGFPPTPQESDNEGDQEQQEENPDEEEK